MSKQIERLFDCQDLITLFNRCFLSTYNTQLVKGSEEPLYLPAGENLPYNTIFFTHDYFASAIHECAHWLIAGEERRKCVDFGYWYVPDGRTLDQQQLFQQAEVKPQALEWILSVACGYPFRVSIDNLNGVSSDAAPFKQAVYEQVKTYCAQGLSERATLFRLALCDFYETPVCLESQFFDLDYL